MIKQLKQYDVQTTPFIATKDWQLLNVQHQDLVLLEQYSASVLIPDTFVALEFIDYSFGNASGILNTDCNVALEQQDYDPVIYDEGISGSGLFYPTDPQNLTGTYKRLVYHQILRAFYNNYQNPLKIFGLETFDFQTSGMQRYLSKAFKVFTLPQQNFGDKIQPGSVVFVDNAFDDNYAVTDDSKGNLLAAPNLFAKIQEIRHIENTVIDSDIAFECPDPIVTPPLGSFSLSAQLTASISGACQVEPFTMSLNWGDPFDNEYGFYIYMATQETTSSVWTSYNYALSTPANVTTGQVYYNLPMVSASFYAVAWNPIGLSDPSNTASVHVTCSNSNPDTASIYVYGEYYPTLLGNGTTIDDVPMDAWSDAGGAKSLWFKNTGLVDTTLTSFSTSSTDFSSSFSSSNLPFVISASGANYYELHLKQKLGAGARSATLTLVHSDVSSPFIITLSST